MKLVLIGEKFMDDNLNFKIGEIEENLRKMRLIKKCKDTFNKKKLTANQAEKILEILEAEE